jgi:hypothetical protein
MILSLLYIYIYIYIYLYIYTFIYIYREYKEFLKQQRTQESIYKGKPLNNDNNVDQKVCIVQF